MTETKGDYSMSSGLHSKPFPLWNSVYINDTNWLTASHNSLCKFILTLPDSAAGTPLLWTYLLSHRQDHYWVHSGFHCNVNGLLSLCNNFLVAAKWSGIRNVRYNRHSTNGFRKTYVSLRFLYNNIKTT